MAHVAEPAHAIFWRDEVMIVLVLLLAARFTAVRVRGHSLQNNQPPAAHATHSRQQCESEKSRSFAAAVNRRRREEKEEKRREANGIHSLW